MNTVIYPLKGIIINKDKLRAEFLSASNHAWSTNYYTPSLKEWSTLSILSMSGDSKDVRTSGGTKVKETDIANQCRYIIDEIIPQFKSTPLSVRFSKLKAGSYIPPHNDLVFGQRVVRLHVPVITNNQVFMEMVGERFVMKSGEAWFFDATSEHSVSNESEEDRIHLLIDILASKQFKKEFLRPLTLNDRIRHLKCHVQKYLSLFIVVPKMLFSASGRRKIINKIR